VTEEGKTCSKAADGVQRAVDIFYYYAQKASDQCSMGQGVSRLVLSDGSPTHFATLEWRDSSDSYVRQYELKYSQQYQGQICS